jgi:hypothetical protein
MDYLKLLQKNRDERIEDTFPGKERDINMKYTRNSYA